MVFKNFEYFIAIAEEGSISKAADIMVVLPQPVGPTIAVR